MVLLSNLIQNPYLYLFIGAFIVYISTFLIYLKKAKKRFQEYENRMYTKIIDDHSKKVYSPIVVIAIIKRIKDVEDKINSFAWCFNLYLPSFLGFEAFCLIGFILSGSPSESFAIMGLFLFGLLFFICLVVALIWDDKN